MRERKRRLAVVLLAFMIMSAGALYEAYVQARANDSVPPVKTTETLSSSPAGEVLEQLAVKGRAPKTGYKRAQFSEGWADAPGCNVRNQILRRDMTGVITVSETDCTVVQGNLQDPYTGKSIMFAKGADTSDDVQIDHVVALSNAWQTGAQQLTAEKRHSIANDPLNLLAVDGPTNNKKGDSDAATWLPPNKGYRCRYVARQIAVKQKYALWVTSPERDAMRKVLQVCPDQALPTTT